MEKLIDLIFISYNTKDKIKEGLESLRKYTHLPYKVYVVDNNSTDGSVEYLRTLDWITLIENKQNLGVSKACNIGIKAGNGYYIVILPGDLVYTPNWLEPMLEMLESDPKIAVVGNRQVTKLNTLFTAGRMGTNKSNISGRDDGAGEENDPDKYNIPVETIFLAGACTVFKREIFDVIGLFDEDYFYGCEDNDICFQARYLGYKCVYCPDSVVIHDHGSSIGTLKVDTRRQLIAAGEEYFLRKWAHYLDDPREYRRDLPLDGYVLPTGVVSGKVLVASLVDKELEVSQEFLSSIDHMEYPEELVRYCFVTNWCGMPRYCYETNRREAPGFMSCREFASNKILQGKQVVATKSYNFSANDWQSKENIGNLLLLTKVFTEKIKAGCYEYLLYIEPNAKVDPKLLNYLIDLEQDIVIFETANGDKKGYLIRADLFEDKKRRQGLWEYFDFYYDLVNRKLKISYIGHDANIEPFTIYNNIFSHVREFEKFCIQFENLLADLKVRGVFQQQKLLRFDSIAKQYHEQRSIGDSRIIMDFEGKLQKYLSEINDIEEQLIPLKTRYVEMVSQLDEISKSLKEYIVPIIDLLDSKCVEIEKLFSEIDAKFDALNKK